MGPGRVPGGPREGPWASLGAIWPLGGLLDSSWGVLGGLSDRSWNIFGLILVG